jgi:hypothetical protein
MSTWFVQKTNRRVAGVVFLTALFLLLGWRGASAQSPTAPGHWGNAPGQSPVVSPSPYSPGGCKAYFKNLKRGLLPHGGDWTDPEKKVLDVLCDGVRYIRSPEEKLVVLTSTFIQALVESNQFDAPGYAGISIDGVDISENLQLVRLQINNTVSITHSKFLGTVDLGYTSTTHNLDFTGSSFLKRLCLTGFSSTQSVFISDSHRSNLSEDSLKGDSSERYDCYQTTDARSYISLNFARIDGLVSIKAVDGLSEGVKGVALSAVSARIGQFLRIEDSNFQSIDLQGLSGGELDIVNTKVGSLDCDDTGSLDGIRIAGAVTLSRSSFLCGLTMSGAQIGSGLSLLGTEISSFDLTGTKISGDLEIGPFKKDGKVQLVKWPRGSYYKEGTPQVILAHASVNVLRAALQSWPGLDVQDDSQNRYSVSPCILLPKNEVKLSAIQSMVNLIGLTASALGDWFRFGTAIRSDPRFVINDFQFKAFGPPTFCRIGDTTFTETNPKVEDLQTWLTAAQFSPSEFEWVQGLLFSSGQPNKARRLAFLKSSITEGLSWTQIGNWPIAASQAASRLLIGYGYCLYASVIWAILLWTFGTLIFSRIPPKNVVAKDGTLITDVSAPTYSFDMLLPIIRLREKHYDLDINGWQRRYFYLHKIMGYIIGIFIIAGLSGLAH